MKLILLTLSLVLFIFAGVIPASAPYELWRVRIIAFGLAAMVAAAYPFPS